MSLKKFGAVLAVAMVAMSAVAAGSASAAVETKAAEWYVSGSTLSGDQAITTSVASHPVIGGVARLTGTIAGLPVKITATGASCEGCKITNKAVTGKTPPVAYGQGKVKFTSAKVDEPANCTVSDENGVAGQIVTKELSIHGDFMDTTTTNQHAFLQFLPPEGTSIFAQLILGGPGCEAIEGRKNVTGSVFGESKVNTGIEETTQQVVFGESVQKTTGANLLLGGNAAEFTSTINFQAGGKPFTIK